MQMSDVLLQRYAAEVWDALSAAPSPDELKEGPRVRLATKLKPFRYCFTRLL